MSAATAKLARLVARLFAGMATEALEAENEDGTVDRQIYARQEVASVAAIGWEVAQILDRVAAYHYAGGPEVRIEVTCGDAGWALEVALVVTGLRHEEEPCQDN